MESDSVQRAVRAAYNAGRLAVHFGRSGGETSSQRNLDQALRQVETPLGELQRRMPGEEADAWHH